MWIHAFGTDYYLDEKAFKERMTAAESKHPWRIEEIIEIQRQMTTLDDLIVRYIQQTAAPDPLDTLRKHLDVMIHRRDNPAE